MLSPRRYRVRRRAYCWWSALLLFTRARSRLLPHSPSFFSLHIAIVRLHLPYTYSIACRNKRTLPAIPSTRRPRFHKATSSGTQSPRRLYHSLYNVPQTCEATANLKILIRGATKNTVPWSLPTLRLERHFLSTVVLDDESGVRASISGIRRMEVSQPE